VLRYHSVQEPERYANSIGAGIIHSATAFQEQMEILAKEYVPVTVEEILKFVSGEKELSRKSVAMTFDEGFRDNYEIAAPVLKRVGVSAAFYIAVSSVEAEHPPWYCRLRYAFALTPKGCWPDSWENVTHSLMTPDRRKTAFRIASKRCAQLAGPRQEKALRAIENDLEMEPLKFSDCPMLTWEQIRGLHQAGHIVGSHSLTHPNLAYVGAEELRRELEQSKQKLEAELGKSTLHFSYPSPILEPHYDERTVAGSKEVGYRTAVTCTSGPVRVGDDPLMLRRVWAPLQKDEFRWALECTLLGRRM
jgi:peptidoglycan/xylan/chitin deacetylase (PgdA/CDA1 family)